MLCANGGRVGAQPGRGNRGQMPERVDTMVHVVDPGQRACDLPVVGEVDVDEPGGPSNRRHPVEVDDLMTVLDQVSDHGAAQLAAAAGDEDAGQRDSFRQRAAIRAWESR